MSKRKISVDLTAEEIVLFRESVRRLARTAAELEPLVTKLNEALTPHLPTADEISGIWSDDPVVREAAQQRCVEGVEARTGDPPAS